MYQTNLNNDKRNQLKSVMDDFTTFNWGEVEANKTAFDKFGAFIVGGKDALKFYNGPSFSNKYITTQFQSQNTTLQSVEFKTMTITFTMGVYWFTIEEYRKLLLWLHPYEVSQLSFSFAPKWYYLAKLSNISDSTRYILGKDSNGEYRYYTEIKLTFEVQGEPCLHNFHNYTLDVSSIDDETEPREIAYKFKKDRSGNVLSTDLDMPFSLSVSLEKDGDDTSDFVSLNIKIPRKGTYTAFNAYFKYLGDNTLTLHYDSAQGLLFSGDTSSILSSLTTSSSGTRTLESLVVDTFKIPGKLESDITDADFKDIEFLVSCSANLKIKNVSMIAHARTNVI